MKCESQIQNSILKIREEMQEHSRIHAKESKIMKLKNLKETTLKDLIKEDISHQNVFPVN